MKNSGTGYSSRMKKVRHELRKLQLPDNLFDADFKEQEEAAQIRMKALIARAREIEESGAFVGVALSSTELREQLELGEQPYFASQGQAPKFKRYFQDTLNQWRQIQSGRGAELDKIHNLKRKGKK